MEYKVLLDLSFLYSELLYSSSSKVEVRVYRNNRYDHLMDVVVNPGTTTFSYSLKDKAVSKTAVQYYIANLMTIVNTYHDQCTKEGGVNITEPWVMSNLTHIIGALNELQYQEYIRELRELLVPAVTDETKERKSK